MKVFLKEGLKMNKRLTEISKTISYALRHHPEDFNLKLNDDGSVKINILITNINKAMPKLKITTDDIKAIMNNSKKQRWGIKNHTIRALYGHSFKLKADYKEIVPPDILYHGTAPRFLANIEKQGILPMSRQKVCLSTNKEAAKNVALRHDHHHYVLITINAKKAYKDGVKFYQGNDETILADKIASKYFVDERSEKGSIKVEN